MECGQFTCLLAQFFMISYATYLGFIRILLPSYYSRFSDKSEYIKLIIRYFVILLMYLTLTDAGFFISLAHQSTMSRYHILQDLYTLSCFSTSHSLSSNHITPAR